MSGDTIPERYSLSRRPAANANDQPVCAVDMFSEKATDANSAASFRYHTRTTAGLLACRPENNALNCVFKNYEIVAFESDLDF